MYLYKKLLNVFIYKILINIIVFYRRVISPVLPARCRYYPTCSTYGLQALQWHGVKRGSWLLLKRLSRCQPLGGHGVDFVPVPLASYTYDYVPLKRQSWVYHDNFSYSIRLNYLLAHSSR